MSMTHDEMIAVIQAHRDGKTIEILTKFGGESFGWKACTNPVFNFGAVKYRVEPEPMVVYVNKKNPCYAYTQNEVDSGSLQCSKDFTKFVEVLGD